MLVSIKNQREYLYLIRLTLPNPWDEVKDSIRSRSKLRLKLLILADKAISLVKLQVLSLTGMLHYKEYKLIKKVLTDLKKFNKGDTDKS